MSKKLATGLQAGIGSHRPEGRSFKPETNFRALIEAPPAEELL